MFSPVAAATRNSGNVISVWSGLQSGKVLSCGLASRLPVGANFASRGDR